MLFDRLDERADSEARGLVGVDDDTMDPGAIVTSGRLQDDEGPLFPRTGCHLQHELVWKPQAIVRSRRQLESTEIAGEPVQLAERKPASVPARHPSRRRCEVRPRARLRNRQRRKPHAAALRAQSQQASHETISRH
ncbi:MAG TPA: hypothetical protein DCP69_01870 [Candidatus Omnitrophica bacterium]|nr:hypothetical protein [Candidatus Omnitrophota bacterium]